uniref:AzlD family protein n=1 Tax=Pararhizobium sp. IMCC3301 TaxID=3067904 RepID=UPI0027407F91|nr:AzlD domain-containing protein [Pararhizobium sp. IMCC3301]
MSDIIWLIVALAGLTYATRFGGHVILSRFKRINPRLEAALDAVPAAVITALVVPAAFTSGLPELAGVAVAVLASLRYSMLGVVLSATATVALLRYLF